MCCSCVAMLLYKQWYISISTDSVVFYFLHALCNFLSPSLSMPQAACRAWCPTFQSWSPTSSSVCVTKRPWCAPLPAGPWVAMHIGWSPSLPTPTSNPLWQSFLSASWMAIRECRRLPAGEQLHITLLLFIWIWWKSQLIDKQWYTLFPYCFLIQFHPAFVSTGMSQPYLCETLMCHVRHLFFVVHSPLLRRRRAQSLSPTWALSWTRWCLPSESTSIRISWFSMML